MKQKEITTEMFEQWKAERKEYFQTNDPKSMNLINLMLGAFDKEPPTEEEIKKREASLLKFYENDLTNQGKLECDICGQPLQVYYTSQCFHCLPCIPKPDKNNRNNYLMAVKWLRNNEKNFNADWVWDYLYEKGLLLGNDTYISLPDSNTESEFYNMQMDIFKKHFEIKDILWFVSW